MLKSVPVLSLHWFIMLFSC